MSVFWAVLIIFLLAFVGLASGIIFGRKSFKGGCSSSPGPDHDCRCEQAAATGRRQECPDRADQS